MSLKTNLSVNSAYALQDHFAVMLNGSSVNTDGNSKSINQRLVEAGVGYFNTFDTEKNRVFELYVGVGKANTTQILHQNNTTEIQKFGMQKVFVQSNYSRKKVGNLNVFGKSFPLSYGAALRLSYMNMNSFTINGENQTLEDNTFFEPLFFVRLNLSKVMQLQYTSGTTIGFQKRNYLKAGNSVSTVGVIFNFGN